MTRLEAACGLAILAREVCDEVEIFTFCNEVVKVPPRRGFALRDAIVGSQPHGGTYLGKAVAEIDRKGDRLIVFTDEQSHDQVPAPKGTRLHGQCGLVPARRRPRRLDARRRLLGSGDRLDRRIGADDALMCATRTARACPRMPGPIYW